MPRPRLASLPRLARTACHSLLARHGMSGAVARLWRARREVALYLATGDQMVAARLRHRFGIVPGDDPACGMPDGLFAQDIVACAPVPATVIIPVYNAAEDVARLFAALPATLDPDQPVLVVDDGSDDPRIEPLITDFLHRHKPAAAIRHLTNMGFVAAANTGFRAARPGTHPVLLNSDTLPPPGWVRRLVAPILADRKVASVTPMSNAAEILSVPVPGHVTQMTPEAVATIDRTAQRLAPRNVALPTGIGFCMALNRRFLDRIGGFDPAFGRGYGEEVDWCCRARKLGGRHQVETRLFVGHRGGASFGSEAKRQRIEAATRIIEQRHPDYERRVRAWCDRAPLQPERLALAIAWLAVASDRPVPVFLGHMLGGGAETALAREIAQVLAAGAPGVVAIRTGGPRAWRLELHAPGFTLAGDVAGTRLLHKLLEPITHRRIVYSCGVGAADPVSVPRLLAALPRASGDRLEIRMHDFFPLSPSWTLLNAAGRFDGVSGDDCPDPAHIATTALGKPSASLADWRARWRPVMERADEITVFAPSGAALVTRAYPETASRVVLRPHQPDTLPGPLAPGGDSIGVLGGINRAKGAAVLARLAGITRQRIVVIGEIERAYVLPPPHIVHGRYEQSRIAALAREYRIGLWFVPSICPETFSFATHEALSTGLPVVSFDLGAQADALNNAPNGHVLPIDPEDDPELLAEVLAAILAQAASETPAPTMSRRAS